MERTLGKLQDITDEMDDGLKKEGYGFTMKTREVASALGISRRTVTELLSDGSLEATKIRRLNVFPRRRVAEYLAKGFR